MARKLLAHLVLAATVLVALAVTTTGTAAAATCPELDPEPFSDVPTGHPFCAEIDAGASAMWIQGHPDGTFRPADPLTRAQAAAMLFRAANGPLVVPLACTEAAFPDVPADHPMCPYIRDAAEAGVLGGFVDGTFHPSASVTRQAMAGMLHRFPEPPVALLVCGDPFADVHASNPFRTSICFLKDLGIVTGDGAGLFHPTTEVTRGWFAAVTARRITSL